MRVMDAFQKVLDEQLPIQVPAIAKRHLGIPTVETPETIRVIVLRPLQAYGVAVTGEVISDRRKK